MSPINAIKASIATFRTSNVRSWIVSTRERSSSSDHADEGARSENCTMTRHSPRLSYNRARRSASFLTSRIDTSRIRTMPAEKRAQYQRNFLRADASVAIARVSDRAIEL